MDLISSFWSNFQDANPEFLGIKQPTSFYYGDNKAVADECASLVLKKIKQATSPSVWWFHKFNEKFPKIGDLGIVTNWEGMPIAVVRTIGVRFVKFKDITGEHARIEGEGNKTLGYWRKAHWIYYANEMTEYGEQPFEDMEIVCEYFETID